MYRLALIIVTVVFCAPVASARAQTPRKEALVDQVKKSINRGVQYLRQSQQKDGSWKTAFILLDFRGGETALAVLALLNSGVPVNDPVVKDGLTFLRGLESDRTYVRALQTMALAEAGQSDDAELIKNHVDWLLSARVYDDKDRLLGWTYKRNTPGKSDNSNSQFAMLGLWAGRTYLSELTHEKLKGRLGDDVWKQIRDFYLRTQLKEGADKGSWNYSPHLSPYGFGGSITMTPAGICGLLISGMELNAGRETLRPDGTAINCGVYNDTNAIQDALQWLGGPPEDRLRLGGLETFTVEDLQALAAEEGIDLKGVVRRDDIIQLIRASGKHDPSLEFSTRTLYNLYGIERLGRLTGLRFIGKHDWYREGCEFLVREQRPDGSWSPPGRTWPTINTSFALLFLSKGRTPVLISKLVHTAAWPRPQSDTDWNNDRNDLRNLTQFASKQLFKRLPLAWQNIDMLRAAQAEREKGRKGEGEKGTPVLSEEDLLNVSADLAQSPILYFNGHKSPAQRFTPDEKKLLKDYVDNGGFLFVEACCGSPAFDTGFKQLAHELWPENPLEYLPADHPVWTSFFAVGPGDPYKLMGIKMGCSRTALIYSPQDMSCQWESNNFKTARGDRAFKLGANVIAYATGMEPPRPRLTPVELASGKDDAGKIPRGYFKVGQLNQGGDWQPAPRAMHNLMDHLRKNAGLDVALKTEELAIDSNKLVDFKFIYLHGRTEFHFPVDKLKKLRFNLDNGGLLFADACCGAPAFDKSFRKFAADLYPKHKLQEVPPNDDLFGKDLNGVALDERNIKYRSKAREPMRSGLPFLEGIKIDNRWVVLYSKYDIGCALERHKSSDCVGYDTDSAERIAGAAVLYLLKLK